MLKRAWELCLCVVAVIGMVLLALAMEDMEE